MRQRQGRTHGPNRDEDRGEQAPADGGKFDTAADIGKRLGCTPEPITAATDAVERAACEDGNLVISIFLDRDQAEKNVASLLAMMEGLPGSTGFVVGGNWTVNCGDSVMTCEEEKGKLGGIITGVTLGS